MNMESMILTGIIAISILLLISIISKHMIATKTINLSTLELQLKTPIDSSVIELLDGFIQECFSEYLFLNAQYSADEDRYISDDEEKEIVKGVVGILSDRMSTTLYKQLSVYYNEKAIPTVISNKIYELVVAYVVQKNTAKSKPVS